MIRIITILLATLTILSNISAQNTADSLLDVYEMEPVIFTVKKQEITYSTLNYFSKKQNFGVKFKGLYPIGIMEPIISNYGVKLQLPTNANYFFINKIEFLGSILDTSLIKLDKFCIVVSNGGKLIKHYLNYSDIEIVENILADEKDVILISLNFSGLEVPFGPTDEIYFFREHPVDKMNWIKTYLFNQRKDKIFTIKDKTIQPVVINYKDVGFSIKHPMWQVRIEYHSYNKVLD